MIFFDKTWDYAQRLQAEHRTWSTGQDAETCYYYDLTGNVGLETMINSNIEKKTDMLSDFKKTALKELIKKL